MLVGVGETLAEVDERSVDSRVPSHDELWLGSTAGAADDLGFHVLLAVDR